MRASETRQLAPENGLATRLVEWVLKMHPLTL